MWYEKVFTEEEKKGTHELAEQIVERMNQHKREDAHKTNRTLLIESFALLTEQGNYNTASKVMEAFIKLT